MKASLLRAPRIALSAALLALSCSSALAQDHQHCFKIKDSAASAAYTADLVPGDLAFATALGCQIKVPAKFLCIDVDKTNVSPTPPGASAGLPGQKSLCYKVKCPRFDTFPYTAGDQFGSRSVAVKKSALVCAPIPGPAPSTTTTTTTVPAGCSTAGDCPTLPNADPACVTGTCQIGSCVPSSYADCNLVIEDGCEVDTGSDPSNCNACGNVCPTVANSTTGCFAGTCQLICDAGFANCDDVTANGCEANINSDAANCGGCGNVCGLGTPNCVAATCVP